MVSIDADVLRTDPGVIALGDASPAALENAANDPNGPACQASLSAFQSALVWKNIYTAAVAVLVGITVIAVAYCVYKLLDTGWDPTSTFTALAGAVTGGGAGFVGRQRNKADKLLRQALEDVGTYCGMPVREQLG
jgi:hypothetical protein